MRTSAILLSDSLSPGARGARVVGVGVPIGGTARGPAKQDLSFGLWRVDGLGPQLGAGVGMVFVFARFVAGGGHGCRHVLEGG
jgi:hypothetical protein